VRTRIGVKLLISNVLSTSVILLFVFILTSYSFRDAVATKVLDKLIVYSQDSQVYVMNRLKEYEYKNVNEKLIELAPFISNYLSSKYNVRVQIFDGRKEIVADSFPAKKYYTYQDVHYAESGIKSYIVKNSVDGEETLFLSSPIYYGNETIGVVRFIYSLSKDMAVVKKMKLWLFGVSVVSIVLIILANSWLTAGIVKPIRVLKEHVEKMRRGEFASQVEIKNGDEVEELANAFNEMSQSMKEYIDSLKEEKEKQKNFTDNITHELKTPISIILGHAELLKRIHKEDDREKSINYIISESEKLLKQVEQLLYISKLNKPSFELVKKENDIALVVKRCVELLKPRFEKFSIEVTTNVASKNFIFDADKIKEVVLNVLDNAIKHSNCTKIKISGKEVNEKYILEIMDNGKGIDKEVTDEIRKNELFPLYEKNSGLGLKISQMIMKKHGGSLHIESVEKKGSTVTLELKI
jgi:two-component system sensor histidine kinase ArlS